MAKAQQELVHVSQLFQKSNLQTPHHKPHAPADWRRMRKACRRSPQVPPSVKTVLKGVLCDGGSAASSLLQLPCILEKVAASQGGLSLQGYTLCSAMRADMDDKFGRFVCLNCWEDPYSRSLEFGIRDS